VRQGEGVSLKQQLDAIERYAAKESLKIVEHFEEKKTAAKRGRPIFSRMLRLLRAHKASGVLMHKIDRSARNLKDWAELGELLDGGIEVHFVNESLDLSSRGGRLSADIQAVVAADYIRNLREETIKGFYGRLKQGFYPMPAPFGYLDNGAGKAKTPDPMRFPLIKRAFELYASGKYSQAALGDKLYRLGLRTKNGKKLNQTLLGRMLRSPFYMGLIRINKTKETFLGVHQALISKSLFEQVQRVLSGNFNGIRVKHDFPFRRLFWCKLCGRSLIPERQKSHVYYRCQNKHCPTKGIREESLEQGIIEKLHGIDLKPEQHEYLKQKFDELQRNWGQNRTHAIEAVEIKLSQVKDRLNRLTDAYLDSVIDHETFEQRKTALLMERRGIEDQIQGLQNGSPELPKKLGRSLELLKRPYLQYISGVPDERRKLIQTVYSNRTLSEKTLEITYALPFSEVAVCLKNASGAPSRPNARMDKLAEYLFNFAKESEDAQDESLQSTIEESD
jgi:DNA invertase Pin-like site-specific DNA recombinase